MYHGLKERGLSDIGQSPSARGGECLFFGSFLSIVLGESPQRTRSQDWPWHSAIPFPHGECRWPVGAEGHAEASYTSKILSLLASHCEKSGGWCLIFHCRDQVLLLGPDRGQKKSGKAYPVCVWWVPGSETLPEQQFIFTWDVLLTRRSTDEEGTQSMLDSPLGKGVPKCIASPPHQK